MSHPTACSINATDTTSKFPVDIKKKQKPTYNLSTWEAGWEGQKFKAIRGTLFQKTKEKKMEKGKTGEVNKIGEVIPF